MKDVMEMSLFDLTGRVAVVTGGNGGIGLGMAGGLAGAGARVVLAGRDVAKGEAAAAQLGNGCIFVACDVTDKAACTALVATAVERFGRLDILVNNAGMSVRKEPQDLDEAEWHRVMDTNMTSAFLCSQAAYPHMVKAGGGKIINIGSMMSLFGAPFAAAYGASKGAIVQFTLSIATAWAKDNIQCNAVLPGWIDTAMTQAARERIPELNANVMTRTPAGRWGVPEDLAGIAVFLAARASDFVTGTAIPCEGGYAARG
jgi:2-dehydro-3-deoxy-D-gluconate 5-dehydrogenase